MYVFSDGGSVSLKNPHVVQNIPPPPPIERINQHGLERHFEIEEPELLAPPQNRRSDVAKVAALAQQPPRFRGSADLNMVPDRFSTEGLENPKNESLDFLRTFFNNVAINTLLVDPPALAGQLCMSSFGLDIPALRYLLLVKGVSPDLEARQYASVTALHCVSEIYTMADAHGRSHVFALLKVCNLEFLFLSKSPMVSCLMRISQDEILMRRFLKFIFKLLCKCRVRRAG